MKALKGLQPEKVMRYFEEISDVPRESAKEDKIADYMENFARERGLECLRDASNNIVIKKPATAGYEDCDPVILQAHMDMVCVKEKGVEHDFDNEGLDLYVEDGLIRARGTTLGADDGIGVAYGLAVLDSDDIKHPALEVVFTTAEEIGMFGAQAFDTSVLKGKSMISFDAGGFTEGRIYVGCAGNIRVNITQKLNFTEIAGNAGAKKYDVVLKGLKGGHAGGEIAKGRGNASVLCARMLKKLQAIDDLQVVAIQGGDRENPVKNSIPDMFTLTVYTGAEKELRDMAAAFEKQLVDEYDVVEDSIKLTVSEAAAAAGDKAIAADSLRDFLEVTFLLPNGVFTMNKRFTDTPECSSNVGSIEMDECGNLGYNFSIRTSKETVADFLLEKVQIITELKGFEMKVDLRLPAWDYEPNSPIKDLVEAEYERIFQAKPRFKVTPASTECSLFKKGIDGLDVISMGPIIYEEHTPNEYMEITSVGVLWNFLLDILEKLNTLPKRGK